MSSSKSRVKILYAEGDMETLDSQAVMLEQAGHQVQKATGRAETLAALQQSHYDLLVLGSTLSRNDRHHLPYMAKKANQEIVVLVMHADGGRHPEVDANIDSGRSIEVLIEAIRAMFPHAAARLHAVAAGR